jgi:hypothetical protein
VAEYFFVGVAAAVFGVSTVAFGVVAFSWMLAGRTKSENAAERVAEIERRIAEL